MARIADINKNDMINGENVCVSVWFQGCPFQCPGCHNPQTWDKDGGYSISWGNLMCEVDEALTANGVQRNLSILGGEPLADYNKDYTRGLIGIIRAAHPNIKIFLWTGYNIEDLDIGLRLFLQENVDVIIDGKYIEEKRDITLYLRGSSNQRVLYKGKEY